MQKSGNYWYKLGTSQAVDSSLINRATTNIVPIGTTSLTYWSSRDCSNGWNQTTVSTGQYKPNDASILNCNYSNGLYFDFCNGGTRNFSNASSYCSSKGMRLPNNFTEVPACSTYFTWTSLINFSGNHFIYDTSLTSNSLDTELNRVRCVK